MVALGIKMQWDEVYLEAILHLLSSLIQGNYMCFGRKYRSMSLGSSSSGNVCHMGTILCVHIQKYLPCSGAC